MVLSLSRLLELLLLAAAAVALLAGPAVAHKEHQKQVETARAAKAGSARAQLNAPKTATRPAVGRISPKISLMVVLLPAPLGPRNP